MWRICQQEGRAFPRHLVVQSDNTVAQAKNSYAMLLLAFLVSRYKFVSANMFFLLVGHTHEDVDQLFGIIVALILRKHDFEVPSDLMEYLLANLQGRFLQKSEVLAMERLSTVRDFAQWLEPLGLTLYNAFMNRQGVEAPHAFSFKLRRDLRASEREWLTRSGRPGVGDDDDVFCCVKTYMRDLDLQHEPVLVLPANRRGRVGQPEPQGYVPVHEMAPKTIEQLLQIASVCELDLGMNRAAAALRDLVMQRLYCLPAPGWLGEACAARPVLLADAGNRYFPHLPQSSWRLLVRHHGL